MADHSIRIIFEFFTSRAILVQWLKRGCIEELQALTSAKRAVVSPCAEKTRRIGQ